MNRLSRKEFEEVLNELPVSDEDLVIAKRHRNGNHGTMLRRYDDVAFNAAYHDACISEEYRISMGL